jgi:hypothetical protein
VARLFDPSENVVSEIRILGIFLEEVYEDVRIQRNPFMPA